jgi:phenylacetate-coenzyme A ligase PaaK-like adenylate-forming protein
LSGASFHQFNAGSSFGTFTFFSLLPLSHWQFSHYHSAIDLPNLSSTSPYIFNYIPTQRFFEEINHELVCTGDNGMPLIRYNIHDLGGIISPGTFKIENRAWDLPGLYLFGRSNHAVVFYGANIYPEHVQKSLEDSSVISSTSGRFFLEVKETDDHDPGLYISIELGPGVALVKHNQILKGIMNHLNDTNFVFMKGRMVNVLLVFPDARTGIVNNYRTSSLHGRQKIRPAIQMSTGQLGSVVDATVIAFKIHIRADNDSFDQRGQSFGHIGLT